VTTFQASLNLLPSSSPAANFRTGEWTFPTLYSTLAPAALADLVFSRYEIDVPKNCQFWHRGLRFFLVTRLMYRKIVNFGIGV